MGQAKKDPSKAAEAEEIKKQVTAQAHRPVSYTHQIYRTRSTVKT